MLADYCCRHIIEREYKRASNKSWLISVIFFQIFDPTLKKKKKKKTAFDVEAALGKVNNENEPPPSANNAIEAIEPKSEENQEVDIDLDITKKKKKKKKPFAADEMDAAENKEPAAEEALPEEAGADDTLDLELDFSKSKKKKKKKKELDQIMAEAEEKTDENEHSKYFLLIIYLKLSSTDYFLTWLS